MSTRIAGPRRARVMGAAALVVLGVLTGCTGTPDAALVRPNECGPTMPGSPGAGTAVDAGAVAVPPIAGAATAPGLGTLTSVQIANAQLIVAVGEKRGIPPRGIVVAAATASQESGFKNYANDGTGSGLKPDQMDVARSLEWPHDAVGRDHGSVNMMQQQYPWWGSLEELMVPQIAIGLFYDALLKVPGWEATPITVAAQTVQRSAFPSAYADDEPLAWAILKEFTGSGADLVDLAAAGPTPAAVAGAAGGGTGGVAGAPCPPEDAQAEAVAFNPGTPGASSNAIIAAAQAYTGTTYAWGGGNTTGPTLGIRDGGVADSFGDYQKVGFDCSGLTTYAVFTGSKGKVTLPRTAATQQNFGTAVPLVQAQPGDLVFFGQPAHHVGIYMGDGKMINAPQSGDVVQVDPITGAAPIARRVG